MRLLARRRFQEGARVELHQAAVALLARGEQHDARQSAAPVRRAADRAPRRRNRRPARSRRSAGCRSPRASRRTPAPRTCCRCRSAPAPAAGRPWRTPRACRSAARLPAANRRNARADARSRDRSPRGSLVIFNRFGDAQQPSGEALRDSQCHLAWPIGNRNPANTAARFVAPVAWPGGPPSWLGAGQALASDAIHVPSGMGDSGPGYPWADGHDERWGPQDEVRKTHDATQTLLTLTKHAQMTPMRHSARPKARSEPGPRWRSCREQADGGQGGGFFDNGAKHDLLPERTENIVHGLF